MTSIAKRDGARLEGAIAQLEDSPSDGMFRAQSECGMQELTATESAPTDGAVAYDRVNARTKIKWQWSPPHPVARAGDDKFWHVNPCSRRSISSSLVPCRRVGFAL